MLQLIYIRQKLQLQQIHQFKLSEQSHLFPLPRYLPKTLRLSLLRNIPNQISPSSVLLFQVEMGNPARQSTRHKGGQRTRHTQKNGDQMNPHEPHSIHQSMSLDTGRGQSRFQMIFKTKSIRKCHIPHKISKQRI